MSKASNITWHKAEFSYDERVKFLGQKGAVVWLTGLSGSGKSSVGAHAEAALVKQNINAKFIDGDNVRHGLNKDLGFSPEDRRENIRRVGEVANLLCESNVIVLAAFISPYQAGRDAVRASVKPGLFFEVYCNAPLSVCEERDPKGLYKKARAGEIKDFTGVNAPYEEPQNPELVLDTGSLSLEQNVEQVIQMLQSAGIIK